MGRQGCGKICSLHLGILASSADLRASDLGERTVWSDCIIVASHSLHILSLPLCAVQHGQTSTHSSSLTICSDSIAHCMAVSGCCSINKTTKKREGQKKQTKGMTEKITTENEDASSCWPYLAVNIWRHWHAVA